jgi:hypothetical protein
MLCASGDATHIGWEESNLSTGPFGRRRVSDGNIISKQGYDDGTSWFNYEIGVNSNGTQYALPTYGGCFITEENLVKQRTIGVYAGGQPIGVVYHPVESIVYFAWATIAEVRAFDTNTFEQTASYDCEYTFDHPGNWAFQWGRLKTSRDGSLLFATVGGVRYFNLYAPLSAPNQSAATSEDTALPVTLAASIGNGGSLSYSIVSGPAHGTLSGTAPDLVHTPNPGYYGPDSFAYRAAYGRAAAEATVSIAIAEVNEAPVAVDDSASTVKNTPVTIAVLANDSDPDGNPLTVASTTAPTRGTATILSGGTSVRYTPRNGFVGTDAFTYTASDGRGGEATATVTVTVTRR